MAEQEKKTFWVIDATATIRYGVVFEEPITADEAKKVFDQGLQDDVISEEELTRSPCFNVR